MKGNLTDKELSLVRDVIASGMGLDFPPEKKAMLVRNLTTAAREFGYNDINLFIQWLLSAPLNKEQMEILSSHLTISETYFWREPNVFTALTDFILPELIKSKKKREKSFRLWSAGCSTGEEPYSLAIALHKTIPDIKNWNISVRATDINAKALLRAGTGIYNPWSFRNSPSWLKSMYFDTYQDRKYQIIPEIKEMVTFSKFNLTNEDFLYSACKSHKMDIIFCRNVLMYFTKEWATKVSQNLYNSLSEEGWLVVSSCELSSDLFPHLATVNFPGAVLYYKGKEKFSGFNIHSSDPTVQLSIKSLPQLNPDIKAVNPLFAADPEQAFTTLPDSIIIQQGFKSGEALLEENKLSIRLLAGQGHLEEALTVCNKVLVSYKLIPGFYFLRASILQELNKNNEAIKSLKQAIYINPDYIMGHFTLGNLFIRQGNIKNANRYFSNALKLLSVCANDAIPEESEGLSAEYIREIILSNLQIQKTT